MIRSEPSLAAYRPDAPAVTPAPRGAGMEVPVPAQPSWGSPAVNAAHSQALRLSIKRPDTGVVVVGMYGEIDLSSMDRLTELIRQRMTAVVLHALVLDLSGVTFCGSCGIELLLHAQCRAEHRGIEMHVVPGTGVVHRLLELTGITNRFSLRDTAAEAVAEVRR